MRATNDMNFFLRRNITIQSHFSCLILERDSVSQVVNSLSSLTQRSEAAVMSISLFRIEDNESNYRENVRKTLQRLQSYSGER